MLAGKSKDAIKDIISEDIRLGVIPLGAKIRIGELADRYDISHIPIREILRELCGEGIIEYEAQKGFCVPTIDKRELLLITDVRKTIEIKVLRDAMSVGGSEWKKRLIGQEFSLRDTRRLELHTNVVTRKWAHEHVTFHELLLEPSSSGLLKKIAYMLRMRTEMYRNWIIGRNWEGAGAQRDVDGEHAALVEAVIRGARGAACDILEYHIVQTTRDILASDQSGPSGPVGDPRAGSTGVGGGSSPQLPNI